MTTSSSAPPVLIRDGRWPEAEPEPMFVETESLFGFVLVEPTGEMSTQTGGRPAALFQFRREVLQERPAPGLRVRGRG